MKLNTKWDKGQQFTTQVEGGNEITLDGRSKSTVSPPQALLAALCSCIGIDIVMILEKMRASVEGLEVDASVARAEDPPRYVQGVHLRFKVQGQIQDKQLERAIQLSLDKYCSVYHSLRRDLDLTWEVIQSS